jgi:hypothetical protein
MPDANIPDRHPHTTVPGRDFGRAGTLRVGDGHDRSATYAILYAEVDEPVDWLNAGRALSAAWLTATDAGVSVLPVSSAVEVPRPPGGRSADCWRASGTPIWSCG